MPLNFLTVLWVALLHVSQSSFNTESTSGQKGSIVKLVLQAALESLAEFGCALSFWHPASTAWCHLFQLIWHISIQTPSPYWIYEACTVVESLSCGSCSGEVSCQAERIGRNEGKGWRGLIDIVNQTDKRRKWRKTQETKSKNVLPPVAQ